MAEDCDCDCNSNQLGLGDYIEIVSITLAVACIVYEFIGALRNRDNRSTTPGQFFISLLGTVIFQISGRRFRFPLNKSENNKMIILFLSNFEIFKFV